VAPMMLDAAVEALQPEAIVVASGQPNAATLLRNTKRRYGKQRVIVNDRDLLALTKLLSLAA